MASRDRTPQQNADGGTGASSARTTRDGRARFSSVAHAVLHWHLSGAAVIVVDLSSGGDQRELVDPPRDCRVPVYLYLKRGRLVLKYQILADLWPDTEAADPGRDALEHYRRGPALRREMFMAEFRYDDWAAPDIARLQELFLEALENAAQLESAQAAHDRGRFAAAGYARGSASRRQLHAADAGAVAWRTMSRSLAQLSAPARDARANTARRTQVRATRLREAIRRDEAIAV